MCRRRRGLCLTPILCTSASQCSSQIFDDENDIPQGATSFGDDVFGLVFIAWLGEPDSNYAMWMDRALDGVETELLGSDDYHDYDD